MTIRASTPMSKASFIEFAEADILDLLPQKDARAGTGLVGDGVTNDLAAFTAAITAGAGRVVELPAGNIILTRTSLAPFGSIPAGTTIRGQGKGVTTLIVSATTADFRAVFGVADLVTFERLSIRRASDFLSVMFQIPTGTDYLTFRDCEFDGGVDLYTTNATHGLSFPNSGTISGIRIERCTFRNFDFPWLQTNTSTATITDVKVSNSSFIDWAGEGLSFNAPVGVNRNVLVEGCTFSAPAATDSALSLAHVETATVTGCTFQTGGEAVHIEDYSTDIVVTGCTFSECGTLAGQGAIEILDVSRVVVSGNTVTNTTALSATATGGCISTHGATSGTTVGGRAKADATMNITISGNTVNAGPNAAVGNIIHVARISITDNTLLGDLAISTSFVESGSNTLPGIKLSPSSAVVGATIVGNRIQGFRFGIGSGAFNNVSLQAATAIAHNTISQCRYGIVATNTKPASFTGNIIQQCIHPMVVAATGNGGAGGGNDPYSITGNNFNGCQRRASINGLVVAVAAGTATIGAGVTLTVEALPADIYNGRTVTFSGGGVLTLTAAAVSSATSMTGNLATANIASGEAGVSNTMVDRPYVAPFTKVNRAIVGNCDSVADTYA